MKFIEADKIAKSYGKGETRVDALKGVDLLVDAGEFVAVMGPSGSGKSTLLGLLGALAAPSAGAYTVDGIDIESLHQNQKADFRREYLGFVFQNFNLIPYLTLAENVMLPLAIKKLGRSEKRRLAAEALERVGLGDKLGRLPGEVSGGEQERAAVSRALVNRPPILLADEPTGNLDQTTSGEVMNILRRLGDEGMTIIMVTHSQRCAAYADRILEMCDGLIVQESSPDKPCAAAI